MKNLADNLGIIGLAGRGNVGRIYYEILKKFELEFFVADPVSNKENFLRDYTELKNCDTIIIALPTEMHRDAIKFFSKDKKKLLVEKPFCLTYEESKKAFEDIKKSELRVMCGLTGLYHPEFRAMYEHLADIGKIKRVKEKLHEANPRLDKYLQNVRGVLTINGIHTLHRFYKMAQMINPDDKLQIEETIILNNSFKNVRGEDYAKGKLKLGNIPFEFEMSYKKDECENGLSVEYETEIFGEKGKLHVVGWEKCDLILNEIKTELYAHPEGHLIGSSLLRVGIGLEEQVREFFRFIKSEEKIHHTVQEGIEAQRLVEECYQKANR